MYRLLINTISLIGVLGSAQAAGAQGPDAVSGQPEPSYVIVAVDVSGSMEDADAPVLDSARIRQTLRDEGQLVFLQLLPFLRSDLYVGVAHFSDRVRYALPSRETGPLLPWGQTFLNESACRNLVRPAEFQASFRSDVAESMNWTIDRIRAARRQYGQGPGKLIILSNSEAFGNARELSRGSGPILDMAKRLAQQQIQVYPILVNSTLVRSREEQIRLSGKDLTARDLMHAVASMTGGKSYRLTRENGFADILMDVFGLGTQVRGELVVSPYDWAIVTVGTPLESVTVVPPRETGVTGTRLLAASGGLEPAAGIRASVISSPRHRTMILRRPETANLVKHFWQGRWSLALPEDQPQDSVRIYRVPDFLVRLEAAPALPWWRHERVQLQARLLDRHRRVADLQGPDSPVSGRDLAIYIKGVLTDETGSFILEKGRWADPGRLYETESFTVGTAGLYRLTGELRDAVDMNEVTVPVLQFTSDVYVHSECVGLEIVNAATDQSLQEVPPAPGPVRIDAQGGQQVYFRMSGKGEFNVELLSGILHLKPLAQTEWSLNKNEEGQLVSNRIDLIEREEQLTGRAEADVRTFAGVRHIELPAFEMVYAPAPLRVECTFTDPREALWVGECHRQHLNISAFPVFDSFRDETLRLFPENLPEARIRVVDMRSGMMQTAGPESRLLEGPQAGGYEGRTLTATYFVASNVPIPPADRCEIDVGAAVASLQGASKTYAVVDPAAQGLFKWSLQQGPFAPPRGPVPQTLFCGEPVRFSAEWRADQNVSAVRFEIPQPEPAESIFVDVPVAPGTAQAQVEQAVFGLTPGQTLPLYVHVTMQPAGADRTLRIKLRGGQFRAEDRRVVLEDLRVGDGAPTDIPGHAWEPVEVPLRVVFSGYAAGDPRHSAVIEQFKKSCVITVTPGTGDAQDVTGTIEWSSVAADSSNGTCELKGHAVYLPAVAGRATVEMTVDTPASRTATGSSVQRAYAHIRAREPRLAVAVHRLTPSGEEPVFDSRKWVRGDGGLSALTSRLSTRLRMSVHSVAQAAGQPSPWRTSVRLLRRPTPGAPWAPAFTDSAELAASGSFAREAQVTENGEYALELVGHDPQSGRQALYFLTPVLTSIQQHEVKPAAAPPAWLTSRVRQWPFEYLVTLYQDTVDLSRQQSVAFQFQLPGQPDTWLDGATLPVKAQAADARQLSARAPRFLPAVDALKDGKLQFRLSAQGLEFLRWEYPGIRVIPPVLEGLVLSDRSNGGSFALERGELTSKGATDLWVRPAFRAAPELEGQWIPARTTVYLWRDRAGGSAGRPADVRVLEQLRERAALTRDRTDLRTFEVETATTDKAVRVLSRRTRWSFWGWPRFGTQERYSLVASVAYRPPEAFASSADPSGTVPADGTVAEWSDIYAVNLSRPGVVPFCWWPLAAVLLLAAVTAPLKLFVPRPGKLDLDMRLEENIAVVEPVRLDNPVQLDLHETSLLREMQLYTQYLFSEWDIAGRDLAQRAGFRSGSVTGTALGALVRSMAFVAGPIRVLLRRAVYARRWAWAAIIPRVRGDARRVRTGLVCVWTSLGARRGRAWSNQSGPIELPREGQTGFISLDLPYQADGVDRSMRVTVRVRRMASGPMETSAPGWPEAGSEFSS